VRGTKMIRVLILAVLILGLMPTQAFAEGPPSFTGTVLDGSTGDPLPYASVALYDGSKMLVETTTDEWGRYSFDSYYPGRIWWDWLSLWGRTCYAEISRIGWTSATTPAKKMNPYSYMDEYTPTDLGVTELDPVPGVTPISPIYGAHRFETADRITQAAYPLGLDESTSHNTTGTVVIAAGGSWADALLAASVAGVEGAPIILAGGGYEPWGYYDTPSFAYDYDPMVEIRRLQPDRAIIVGGERAVPLRAELDLKTWLGGDDVIRLWGDDRYGTAREAGAYVAANASQPATLALVATGDTFADVLASSALIWTGELPVFLADAEGISQETLDEMTAAGITGAMVVGGTAAVPASAEASLVATFGDVNVSRIGGADRYGTSVLLADWAQDVYGLDYAHVALASGNTYADALTGGPLQGRSGSVLLLTRKNALPPAVTNRLSDNASAIQEVRVLGGPYAIAKTIWEDVSAAVD